MQKEDLIYVLFSLPVAGVRCKRDIAYRASLQFCHDDTRVKERQACSKTSPQVLIGNGITITQGRSNWGNRRMSLHWRPENWNGEHLPLIWTIQQTQPLIDTSAKTSTYLEKIDLLYHARVQDSPASRMQTKTNTVTQYH